MVDGRRRDIGLGCFPAVSLTQACTLAAANGSVFAEGRDPLADKEKASMPTFREAARIVYQAYIPRCRSGTAESTLPTLLSPLRIPNACLNRWQLSRDC